MSSSLSSLQNLTAEFPQEEEALDKLTRLISEGQNSSKNWELTINRIYDQSHFSSLFILAEVLQRLVDEGILQKIIRIETAEGGIAEYTSLDEIPSIVHNWRNDRELIVDPSYLKTIYKLLQHAS